MGKIIVDGQELKTALRALVPLTSKNMEAPVLANLHVMERGGRLFVEATDRYVLGIVELGLKDGSDVSGVDFQLTPGQVKMLVSDIGTKSSEYVMETASDGAVSAGMFGDRTFTFQPTHLKFPELGRLMVGALESARDPHVKSESVSPAKMAQFKVACGRNGFADVLQTGTAFIVLPHGYQEFMGLVMQAKTSDGALERAAGWEAALS